MKFIQRSLLLTTLTFLSLQSVVLWFQYQSIRGSHVRRSATPSFTEVKRDFTPLSPHSADVLYQPPLNNQPHYKLLILTISAGRYYKRRSAVRNTWLARLDAWNVNRPQDAQIAHFFVTLNPYWVDIRTDLLDEAKRYGDIVVFSHKDAYKDLGVSTLTGLDWAYSQFTFDFVLKTDDDSLVNVGEVVRQLGELDEHAYAGMVHKGRRPADEKMKSWAAKYHGSENKVFSSCDITF